MRAPFSRTFFELLTEQAERAPEAAAVIARGETTTFSTLASRAARVAATLRAQGLRRGDRVGLLLDNRVEWLEIFLGAVALGAVVVPLSTWSTRRELEFLFEDSGIRTLFVLARLGERDFAEDVAVLTRSSAGGKIERVVVVGESAANDWPRYDDWVGEDETATFAPGDAASASDVVCLLYTSGSSSRPKSVPIDHFATIENGFNIGERQGLVPGDRVFVPVPLFWSYGASNALPAAVSHGACLVLQSRFEPEEAISLIEAHRCTAIYTLPAITSALLAAASFEPARTVTLRTGVTIGAPQDVVRAATELGVASICNVYGATETYGNCCVTPSEWPLDRRARCQGPPLPGVTVRIRDPESGALLDADEMGEVEVSGYLTRGYAGDSARHNDDVFTEDGFFRTGDLAALGADGSLRYSGRRSEMIKRSGINVSPAEVEEVLQQHPDVGLAGVTGAPDAVLGERIIAFVVARRGAAPDALALAEHCQALLSKYKLPDRIDFREALPLTPTGKLMRRELRALAERLDASAPSG